MPFATIIRAHHERWDGLGYPDKLKGSNIPLDARIIAIADAFDAMTVDRVYRPAKTFKQARQAIIDAAGTQFDPVLAILFASNFQNELISNSQ